MPAVKNVLEMPAPKMPRITVWALLAAVASLLAAALAMPTITAAKEPGGRHCYGQVCVRVLNVTQIEDLLGRTFELTASHYDDPTVDPFNRGTFTSNGERFVADDPTRTASATFPDGTELLLRNPATGHVSHVRVNDFGPFWINRDLDVTRRVAEDLGFARKGVTRLEVTIVSPPLRDDVRRLYRHDRPPVPTLGHLGVRSREETATLARILMQRSAAGIEVLTQRPQQTATAGPAVVRRETIYRIVAPQPASPRALGAEEIAAAHQKPAEAWLASWLGAKQARRDAVLAVFLTTTLFLAVALLGPPLQHAAAHFYRQLYRRSLAGWDVEELKALAYGTTGGSRAQPHHALRTPTPSSAREVRSYGHAHGGALHEANRYGSARPPLNRTGLFFSEAYIWPDLAAAKPEVRPGKAQPQRPSRPCASDGAIASSEMMAHEKLLIRLRKIDRDMRLRAGRQTDRRRGAA